MSAYFKTCACNGFPVCACALGLQGAALLIASRRLSALAGWPARVTAEAAARVLAEHRPARPDPLEGWYDLGCGCG